MSFYQQSSRVISRPPAVGSSRIVRHLHVLISCLWIMALQSSFAILDNNHNGVSDVFEKEYNAGELFPESFDLNADPDGDGWTNAKEAAAGTNPFEANGPDGFVRLSTTHTPAVFGPPDANGLPIIVTPETITLSWPTINGKQYQLLYSTDLAAGSWQLHDEFSGSEGALEYGIPLTQPDGSIPPHLFWRVAITDIDTDGDGLKNAEEWTLHLDPNNAQTLAGVPDLWLAQNFQDALISAGPSSIDLNADPDGDGSSTLEELQGGTNPNVADGPGSRKWITVTGNGAKDIKVTRTGTLTVPAGESRILIIATASDEFPVFTGQPSEFNDLINWDVLTSQGASFVNTIDVNDRDIAWKADLKAGTSLPGLLPPVHFEKIQAITAPVNQDVTIQVTVGATNIEDNAYPSQVSVGFLPMIVNCPELYMFSGHSGDKVALCQAAGVCEWKLKNASPVIGVFNYPTNLTSNFTATTHGKNTIQLVMDGNVVWERPTEILDLKSRADWGAEAPDTTHMSGTMLTIEGVTYHHSGNTNDGVAEIQRIQREHKGEGFLTIFL